MSNDAPATAAETQRPSIGPAAMFGLLPPEIRIDPYPIYHQLRMFDPIIPLLGQAPGFWIVTSYAVGEQILRDRRFATVDLNAINTGPKTESVMTLMAAQQRTMLMKDPPDHTRLRGLVSKAFTPRMINSLRPRIQEIAEHLLDAVRDRSAMDLIADYAYPLPVIVIAEMLGVPAADRDKFRDWSHVLASTLDPVVELSVVEQANQAMAAFREYFAALVAERRQRPREDLLSAMVAAEDGGDRLSQDELLANAVLLLGAGHETTANLIGNGTLALLRNPGQLAKLRDDPSLIESAVEELLRYDSPVQGTIRRVVETAEFRGKTMRPGEHAVVLIGAANRDPARFPDPDRLDITRTDNQHLAFSGGIHFCLGANLARVEGQIAIATLLSRMPALALKGDAPRWRNTTTLRGLETLPVVF